jgi:hypothetical protein
MTKYQMPAAAFSISVFQFSISVITTFSRLPILYPGVIPSHGVARNRLRRTFGLLVLTVFAAFPLGATRA